jgi:hypothetical protein
VGSGHFRKNGVDQAELVNISVTAAELGTTQFVLGGGSDVLWVQAYDGTTWSAWKSFTVFPPRNNAPVVAINGASLSPAHGTATIAASSFFSVNDADGDTITQYRFFDGNAGNGRLELNGTPQVELTNVTINAADLANFRYRTSATGGGDVLWVQAFDGLSWSAWKSFGVAAPQNSAPVVSVVDRTPARGTSDLSAASLFSVADADGDAITQYRFFDGTAGNGRFELNGVAQVELTNITVNAGDLANFSYRTSATGAGDMLWVQAFDGTAWGTWKSFNVAPPQNNAPAVTTGNVTVAANTAIAASSLFSAADGDGDTITRYQFWDSTPDGGVFRVGGVAQAANVNIDVMASQLAATDFLSAGRATTDQLWVRANDGIGWGDWKPFYATTLAPS